MGHKEGGQGDCAIGAIKPVGRLDMVFKGSVEPFNELLIGSVGFGLCVEILEADHLVVL